MKKRMKRIAALAAAAVMAALPSISVCAEEGYTYNYDWWGDVQYSPDAYRVVGVFGKGEMGLDTDLKAPEGLFVKGSTVYLCDTGNNRVLELERVDADSLELKREITGFTGGDTDNRTFAGPTDVAVDEEGYLYICDQNNNRILKLDQDLNLILEFLKPLDSNFDQDISFLPDKITVDTAGRVYCVATNVNKGLIKYEPDGVFSGFVGASKVIYDWTDYIWKQLATKEQRAQMESFVPTEYDNVYMDEEGFIYACTTNVTELEVDNDTAEPVRRLNLMGNDILIRNGNFPVIGDIWWGSGGGYDGISKFIDVTGLENNSYACLDKVRGRIFAYDSQGRMLYAFGGNGNLDGYFRDPVAIEHMGRDLLVLDGTDRSITLFTPTHFGTLVFDAIDQFQSGNYTLSGETWEEALTLNGNYDLAYIGIGRSLLRQERYKEAMDYFSLKLDVDNYSNAFKQYRKEWVEDHIVIIILVIFLVMCVPLAVGKVKAIKHEIDIADIFRRQ